MKNNELINSMESHKLNNKVKPGRWAKLAATYWPAKLFLGVGAVSVGFWLSFSNFASLGATAASLLSSGGFIVALAGSVVITTKVITSIVKGITHKKSAEYLNEFADDNKKLKSLKKYLRRQLWHVKEGRYLNQIWFDNVDKDYNTFKDRKIRKWLALQSKIKLRKVGNKISGKNSDYKLSKLKEKYNKLTDSISIPPALKNANRFQYEREIGSVGDLKIYDYRTGIITEDQDLREKFFKIVEDNKKNIGDEIFTKFYRVSCGENEIQFKTNSEAIAKEAMAMVLKSVSNGVSDPKIKVEVRESQYFTKAPSVQINGAEELKAAIGSLKEEPSKAKEDEPKGNKPEEEKRFEFLRPLTGKLEKKLTKEEKIAICGIVGDILSKDECEVLLGMLGGKTIPADADVIRDKLKKNINKDQLIELYVILGRKISKDDKGAIEKILDF